ncbi:MAG: Xaa-Pro peptidase family protein [Chloroflexota bacterium]|nr:Xaa-Pro peptidase family protein [Chloroflexota bacterium]
MRLRKLRESLGVEGLDAMFVTQPQNIRYLSGFTGGEGIVLVVTPQEALAVTTFIYHEQVRREAPDWELIEVRNAELVSAFPDLIARLGVRRIGFESTHVTVEQHHEWAGALPDCELVPVKDVVEDLRAVKDEEEIDMIKQAVALADAAFTHIVKFIRPGMMEKEVSWELEAYMRTHGAEKVSFDIIVGSGPNGALPHATVSERLISAGEPIVMDLGAVVDGYCSDLTRTIVIGEPDDTFRKIHDAVLRAQVHAEAKIVPGMTGQEADDIARAIITEVGYGDAFGHSLGHGVGLAVHEKPWVSRVKGEDVLSPGMVFTVEPGIYLPGWGGVRIEDVVVLREDGCQVLNKVSKEPIILL